MGDRRLSKICGFVGPITNMVMTLLYLMSFCLSEPTPPIISGRIKMTTLGKGSEIQYVVVIVVVRHIVRLLIRKPACNCSIGLKTSVIDVGHTTYNIPTLLLLLSLLLADCEDVLMSPMFSDPPTLFIWHRHTILLVGSTCRYVPSFEGIDVRDVMCG